MTVLSINARNIAELKKALDENLHADAVVWWNEPPMSSTFVLFKSFDVAKQFVTTNHEEVDGDHTNDPLGAIVDIVGDSERVQSLIEDFFKTQQQD